MTGTNPLGLVKHNAISDARYFGEVFDRPFAEPLVRWDDEHTRGTDDWAPREETSEDIVGLDRRAVSDTSCRGRSVRWICSCAVARLDDCSERNRWPALNGRSPTVSRMGMVCAVRSLRTGSGSFDSRPKR